jgi:predicted acyl esterase
VFAGLFSQQEPCRVSPGPATGGYTATSAPLPGARRYAGLGYVSVPYTLTGATTATIQARVWDVRPDGTELLVTRGTYRIDTPAYDTPAGVLRLALFGNDWVLRSGHSVRLDLTQDDHPTFRPSTLPSSIAFQAPRLVLPTRESGSLRLPGG